MKSSILGGMLLSALTHVIGVESVHVVAALPMHNELFYDSTYGIFCVANHEKNFALSTNAKFTLISNCTENDSILIDMNTRQAVMQTLNPDFKYLNGSIDYSKVGRFLQSVFTKYEAITSKTPSSFSLDVVVENFLKKEFDLKKILKDTSIADRLNSAFGHWLQDVEKHFANGGEKIESLWDLLSTVPQLGRNINNALVKIIKNLSEYFGKMEPLIILNVIKTIRDEAHSIMIFADKFSNYLTTKLNKTIQNVINYIKDPNTNPITFNVTTNNTAYYISASKIDSAYILRYSSSSESLCKNIAVKVVYINGVLLFINENDRIVLSLYRDMFDIINLNTYSLLSGTLSGNISLRMLYNYKLVYDISQEKYAAAIDSLEAQIVESNTGKEFPLKRFWGAMKSSSQSAASEILGEQINDDIWNYYHMFFMNIQEDGIVGILIGVLGDQQCHLLDIITKFTGLIATTTQNYEIIIKYLSSLIKTMFG